MWEERTEVALVQCMDCGHIYQIHKTLSSDAFIIESWCPGCECTKAINCGDNINDIYLYMDINIDPRNYTY